MAQDMRSGQKGIGANSRIHEVTSGFSANRIDNGWVDSIYVN